MWNVCNHIFSASARYAKVRYACASYWNWLKFCLLYRDNVHAYNIERARWSADPNRATSDKSREQGDGQTLRQRSIQGHHHQWGDQARCAITFYVLYVCVQMRRYFKWPKWTTPQPFTDVLSTKFLMSQPVFGWHFRAVSKLYSNYLTACHAMLSEVQNSSCVQSKRILSSSEPV